MNVATCFEASKEKIEWLEAVAAAMGRSREWLLNRKSQQERLQPPETPPTAPVEVNDKRIKRVTRFFDHQGRLVRWSEKFSQRMLCL